MRNIQKILLFFLLYLFFFINVCNATSKHRPINDNKKNKVNNKYRKRNSKGKYSKRKLSDPEEKEFPFLPLKIYLDMEEFEFTFPTELNDYKNNYLKAMNKSKSILEDFLEIQTDTITDKGIIINTDNDNSYVPDHYGITKFTEVFSNSFLYVTDYNYYILAKFTNEIKEESASVILDDFARAPLVGIILFNNNTESLDKTKLTLDYLTNLMLHHFIRLLGFNAALSEDRFGYLPYETVDGKKVYYLKTEGDYNFTNVLNYAKKYFNCQIERIDLFVDDENLDDEGYYYQYCENNIIGLYWPKRLFLGELLTKFDYPEEQVLSGFTLAFLDDLPYLRVTKNYTGGSLKFGKNKGCEFFYNYCGNSSNSQSTFANEFFLPSAYSNEPKQSCSSGRLSKTIYKLEAISNEDKENNALIFEYFLNGKQYGGSKATNFCPIAQFDDSSTERYIYSGSCSEPTTTLTNGRDEEISDNSFCVLSSLVKGTTSAEPETDVLSLCYKMECSPKSLTIKIGEYYIVCPREGGKIKADNFNGYLLCPDYYLICNSYPLCNNLLNCLKLNSTEKEESFYYTYDGKEIRTTQDSTIYGTESRNYGWELTNEGTCPYLCMQCKSHSDCTRCAPHYTFKNGECVNAIEHCDQFVDQETDTCTKCVSGYFLAENTNGRFCEIEANKNQYFLYNEELQLYKKCEISNCQKCSSETQCIICNTGFNLIQGDDSQITCQNTDISQYYPINDGIKTYYRKCEKAITNCEECSASNHCTKCKTNFGIVDNDHTQCISLAEEKYYYDTTLETFKLCSNKMANCETCSTYGDFTCKKCFANYSLKHDSSVTCEEKTSLEGNDNFYMNNSGTDYYSCRLYHDVLNCEKCRSKEICEECQSGYNIYNDKRLCAKQGDIDNNIFTWTNDGKLMLCSSVIKDCQRCNDTSTCYSCQDGAGLIDNDTCVDKTVLEQNKNHYYNETSKRYISCSVMDNCITCDSSTVCTSCQEGFTLNDHSCNNIANKDDDDDGLSTGAIIGIVFGCVGFLLLVAGVVYFLMAKVFKKNNNNDMETIPNEKVEIPEEKADKEPENEEKNLQKEKENEAVVHTTRRTIHNA